MLRLTLLFTMSLLMLSCAKDSKDLNEDSMVRDQSIEKTIGMDAFVSYVDHSASNCEKSPMAGEQVYLIPGKISIAEYTPSMSIKSRRTNSEGLAYFENLEEGEYSLYVSTAIGDKIVYEVVKDRYNTTHLELVK